MPRFAGILAFAGLLAAGSASLADEPKNYDLGPDSQKQEGVPEGKVTWATWDSSEVFPGTSRQYGVYVPAQYDGSTPAKVMVFQDGHTYADPKGQFRVPVVLDNLIHQKQLPVIVAVFINPGHKGDLKSIPSPWKANNRSVEYDTLSDAYARFVIDEILPEVRKSVKLSDSPDDHAIAGISSGGICAWTVAWERPDQFCKVLSHVGSFTNIRGGHVYPALIRKTKPTKPIRVFLQDGTHDVDNEHGNWWLSNLQMESALKFAKYDYKFVGGEGGHNGNHGGAILPESLVWLWR